MPARSVPRVRPARPEEAGDVAALLNAINSLDRPAPTRPMTAEVVMRDLLGPSPRALLRVAGDGGGLLGCATAGALYDAERHGMIMMLLDLYVRPEARRQAIGRALMAGIAGAARAEGALGLWWGVDDGDHAAMAFYAAIGAERYEHFTGYGVFDAAFARLAAA